MAQELPVVTLTLDRTRFDRVVRIEVDGTPIPNTTRVVVEDGMDCLPQVTITLLAGRVDRVDGMDPDQ